MVLREFCSRLALLLLLLDPTRKIHALHFRYSIIDHVSITDSIVLLDLHFPPFVREGDTVELTCVYDLEYDGLYSLKWYKDDVEFFTYTPRMTDGSKKRFFDLPGVHIDVSHVQSIPR